MCIHSHNDPINSIALMPDNQHVISASHDGTLKMWHLRSKTEQFTIKAHNDIVWAVNPHADNLYSLLERLKDFALQLTAVKDIKLVIDLSTSLSALKLSMEQRKNIYLICKESINNAVKYSNCTLISVEVYHQNKIIDIRLIDNGDGFLPDEIRTGNGLTNMLNRAKEIGATLSIDSLVGIGTSIKFICKIT